MTIHHDMYLLDLATVRSALTKLIPAGQNAVLDKQRLLTQVVHLLETNTTVQYLSKDYGDWDAKSIQQEFNDLDEMTSRDIGWLLSYVVLSAVDTTGYHPTTHGFGAMYHDIPRMLIGKGWSKPDAKQLIYGQSFASYLAKTIGESNRQPYWDSICPASMGAHMGWLSVSNAKLLFDVLQNTLSHWNPQNRVPKRLRFVAGQLEDAIEREMGLCIVISG